MGTGVQMVNGITLNFEIPEKFLSQQSLTKKIVVIFRSPLKSVCKKPIKITNKRKDKKIILQRGGKMANTYHKIG